VTGGRSSSDSTRLDCKLYSGLSRYAPGTYPVPPGGNTEPLGLPRETDRTPSPHLGSYSLSAESEPPPHNPSRRFLGRPTAVLPVDCDGVWSPVLSCSPRNTDGPERFCGPIPANQACGGLLSTSMAVSRAGAMQWTRQNMIWYYNRGNMQYNAGRAL
jgi:hypothetical protein